MISNRIVKVKADTSIQSIGLPLKKDQELEIVMDMVYMNGFPLSLQFQKPILTWISENPSQLIELSTRK